ncbi:hypothetical protein JY97_11985 [Alkalispirochaeta odontotermitis]|nr:hypothetical protein JY97_11985 [Alkalispirochaeta odontotermitis]
MLDSILLEKKGIPAISIVTDAFVETGNIMASNWGLPGFRFLSVRHPVANLNNEELDHRAKDVVNDVVDLLQQGQGSNSGI